MKGGMDTIVLLFALYVIITQRLPVTNQVVLTGQRARNFGIGLLVLCIPVLAAIDFILALLLPAAARTGGLWQGVRWILFGVLVVAAAVRFRDAVVKDVPMDTGTEE